MDTSRAIFAGNSHGWIPAVRLLAICLVGLAGCDKPSPRPASAGQGEGGASAAPALRADRYLTGVRTSWSAPAALGLGTSRRHVDGSGAIIACDGHWALVLTSRRLVDPPYDPKGPGAVRDVVFQVYRPGQATPAQGLYGRLVAVYMNAADLALLRIEAPTPERFSMPILPPGQLRPGEPVTLVGRPAGQGFFLASGQVANLWPDPRLAGWGMHVDVSSGTPDTVGILLAQRGTCLAGLVCARRAGTVTALAAGGLTQADCWEYLMEETSTRQLLSMVR